MIKETVLGIGDTHVGANLLHALVLKIKAREDIAIAGGNGIQDTGGDLLPLPSDGGGLRVQPLVGNGVVRFEIDMLLADLDGSLDIAGNLPADNGAHEAHQALGLTKIAAADRLDHDQKAVVYPVVQVLRT